MSRHTRPTPCITICRRFTGSMYTIAADLHEFETGVKFCQKIAKNREHPVSFNGLQIKGHRIYKM